MTTVISRRKFIRVGCCSIAALGAASSLSRLGLVNAFAAPADYRALVCIFLFGGNDGNNVIVPLDSRYGDYQKIRGGLALAQSSLLPISDLANNPWGLHPNLKEIQALFNQHVVAAVLNVGVLANPVNRAQYLAHSVPVPQNLFSHSDQQIQWQSAIASTIESGSGWGGRVSDVFESSGGSLPPSISIAGNNLFLTGQKVRPATIIPNAPLGILGSNGSPVANARDAALQQILAFDSGFSLIQTANGIMFSGLQTDKLLNSAFAGAPALATIFPKTSLGAQLQQVAKIIQVRSAISAARQIFFCSLGGFDTHSNELNSHVALYTQLSQAIDAFYQATGELGVQNQVTSFTQSDFGRTFQPSATGGTDHAWGNHHLVVGGAVKGGVYGELPIFALNGPDDANNRGVWIPTVALDQYGATLASWFGLSAPDVPTVFPQIGNFSTSNLGFV